MSPTAKSWHGVVEQVSDGCPWVDEVSPDWLEAPGTGVRLSPDVLYPELGIAFWFTDSHGVPERSQSTAVEMLVSLCHHAGIVLVVVDGKLDSLNQTLGWLADCLEFQRSTVRPAAERARGQASPLAPCRCGQGHVPDNVGRSGLSVD